MPSATRLDSAASFQRVLERSLSNGWQQHQPGDHHRQPDPGSRARDAPGSGTVGLQLRIACNARRKNDATGQWEEKPNYFGVTVWGAAGRELPPVPEEGPPVAIDGRLRWREWTTRRDRSAKRSISSLIPCSSSAGATTPAEREWVLQQRPRDGERRSDRHRRFRDRASGCRSRRRRHSVLRQRARSEHQ